MLKIGDKVRTTRNTVRSLTVVKLYDHFAEVVTPKGVRYIYAINNLTTSKY
jgi:hypothetical protein